MGDAGVVDVSLVLDAEALAVEREVDAEVVDALGLELLDLEGAFADRVGPTERRMRENGDADHPASLPLCEGPPGRDLTGTNWPVDGTNSWPITWG